MIFGEVPLGEAEGAILAHSVTAGAARYRKGRRIGTAELHALAAAGVTHVTIARLEADDIGEDEAARRIADRMKAPGIAVSAPFTGRANLHAEAAGILTVDADAVNALNHIHEAVTLATLPAFARVGAREMLATVKIIPYAAPRAAVEAAEAALATPPLRLHPFRTTVMDLVLTETPGMKRSLLEKAEQAMRDRLDALGCTLGRVETVPHRTEEVAAALGRATGEAILIFGATATSDRRDVCPAGLKAAGGEIQRFGMPVDPGNLIFTGRLGDTPVIGLPGCARSPALNGADWVLERVAAGMLVGDGEIAAMGVGGLLKEIATRPQPRAGNRRAPTRPFVEVLILAGGASSRMRGRDKLMEEIEGIPQLRRAAEAALASRADRVSVVIPEGHGPRRLALEGLDINIVEASGTQGGMAVSLRAGLAARAESADAVVVMLADMPEIGPAHIDRLIAAFDPAEGRTIARALAEDGTPGHPVLFGKRFFEPLMALEGDSGAKALLSEAEEYLVEVPTPGRAAVLDLDTPEAWDSWRAEWG